MAPEKATPVLLQHRSAELEIARLEVTEVAEENIKAMKVAEENTEATTAYPRQKKMVVHQNDLPHRSGFIAKHPARAERCQAP